MMVEFTTYSLETGEFETTVTVAVGDMLANTPDGYSALLGRWDPAKYRVENGGVVEKPVLPPRRYSLALTK